MCNLMIYMIPRAAIIGLYFVSMFPRAELRLWQENPRPRLQISADEYRKTAKQFVGNGSFPDFFRLLERDGSSLLVGARNIVYNISISSLSENQRLEWHASEQDIRTCTMKGKNQEECQNYIRVLMKKSARDLLICGTNAYTPRCRDYSFDLADEKYEVVKDFAGVGLCPYDPKQNSTAIQVDGQLYAATVTDFASQDAAIIRNPAPLRTGGDTSFFNEPNFVGSFSTGSYVYVFFRENALEYTNCGKSIYSRVARVCRNDRGNSRRKGQWTSFLKTRLNCSVPGEYPFYFNEIQSVSALVTGTYNGHRVQLFYGVFNTPGNSIFGSAVCAFTITEVDRAFSGRFKEQKMNYYNWLPVSSLEVPEPRPGQCVNDSQSLADESVQFVNSHMLMDEAVQPLYGRPILIFTSLRERYTTVAVVPQVRAADQVAYDIVFVGTDDGRIVKSVNLDLDDRDAEPVIIEEIEVLKGHPVTNMLVVDEQIIVVFQSEIHSLPLERCLLALSCRDCVNLRDPHCAWVDRRCVASVMDNGKTSWNGIAIQNIKTGVDVRCTAGTLVLGACCHRESCYGKSAGPTLLSTPMIQGPDLVASGTCRVCISQCPECTIDRKPHLSSGSEGLSGDFEKPYDQNMDLRSEVHDYQTANIDAGRVYRVETLAVAVVLSFVLSLLVGFVIGYLVAHHRRLTRKELNPSEASDYSYGNNPTIPDSPPAVYQPEPIYAPLSYPGTKPVNVVLNIQKNTLKNVPKQNSESAPVPASRKVYL